MCLTKTNKRLQARPYNMTRPKALEVFLRYARLPGASRGTTLTQSDQSLGEQQAGRRAYRC